MKILTNHVAEIVLSVPMAEFLNLMKVLRDHENICILAINTKEQP